MTDNNTPAQTDSQANTTNTQQAQTTPATSTAQSSEKNTNDIYNLLDSVISKRTDGIAKSALKDNGLTDEELKDVLTAYKEHKQNAVNVKNQTVTTLQAENQKLQQEITNSKLNAEVSRVCLELGVDSTKIGYAQKLADLKDVVGKDNVIDAQKVKTALEQVVNDLPALKAESGSTGFTAVGANGGNQNTNTAEDSLRKAMGLKPKN